MKAIFVLFIVAVAVVGGIFALGRDAVETSELTVEKPSGAANVKGKRAPVIVELFTSEGCSSCPPADGNLQMLAREQPVASADIIVLSLHVDYWNRLGWIDPFSSQQFSRRQSEYADFFKHNDVYTPQMIVDGTREFVGGDMRAALKQIADAAGKDKGDVAIEIGKIENNTVAVTVKTANLPKIGKGDTAIVLLAVTENNLNSNVTRGENDGRQLRHTAVVRSLQNIGAATDANNSLTASIALDKNWKRENLNLVAFVQEVGERKIIGAARVELPR